MEPAVLAYLTALSCLAFTVQTAAGFGAGLVLVTLGALAVPIQDAVTLLIPLSVGQSAFVLARYHGAVAWRTLFRFILPLMGSGAVVGAAVVKLVHGSGWKRAYGGLVLLFALRELSKLLRRAEEEEEPKDPAPTTSRSRRLGAAVATFAAGVLQAVYATGGPPLVWAVDRLRLDKQAFRTTLLAVWLGINLSLSCWFLVDGRLGRAQVVPLALLYGGVAVGLVVGEWVHRRVDERRFRIGVYLLLLLAGAALLAG